MLGWIPMNDIATVLSQTGNVDRWGKPVLTESYTGKCQINYNTNLEKISGLDGFTSTMSATVLFKGFVMAKDGDYIQFTADNGVTNKYQVIDVFYFKDYVGNIMATRVVVGNGKRA